MTARFFLAAITLVFVFPLLCQESPERGPALTVCEALRGLNTYNGKTVIVVGIMGFTFEGNFVDEHCEADGHVPIQGNRWLSMIAVYGQNPLLSKPPTFQFDEDLVRRKYEELKGRSKPFEERRAPPRTIDFGAHWVAILGELSSPPVLKPQRPGPKNIHGNGFGANGTVPAKITQFEIHYLAMPK